MLPPGVLKQHISRTLLPVKTVESTPDLAPPIAVSALPLLRKNRVEVLLSILNCPSFLPLLKKVSTLAFPTRLKRASLLLTATKVPDTRSVPLTVLPPTISETSLVAHRCISLRYITGLPNTWVSELRLEHRSEL